MNPQEREQLTRFLQQLAQAQAGAKDVDAERLIQETCTRQPDANYLLVLRALLLEQALGTAQTEITRLQNELAGRNGVTGGGSGFLDSNAWGNTPTATRAPQGPAGFMQSAPPLAPEAPSRGMGLLGTVATTAAGVVAGAFLYQGIENLIGHHGNGADSLASNNPAPTSHATSEKLISNAADEPTAPPVDLDSLGPDDEDAGWA